MNESRLQIALDYVARGWRCFPLHSIVEGQCSCGGAANCSAGKHPRTKHGLLEATTTRRQIEDWWTQWPEANIGIATGIESGLVIIDIDPKNGGDESFIEFKKRYALPETPEVITGSGGRHLYFAYPATRVRNAAGLLGYKGIDLRGEGGYVAAAGSSHLSGQNYEWDIGTVDHPLAPYPEALIAAVPDNTTAAASKVTQRIPRGQRDQMMASVAGSMRRRGLNADEIAAALDAVNQRCDPPLPHADLLRIARSVERYVPSTAISSEPLVGDPAAEEDVIGVCLLGGGNTVAIVMSIVKSIDEFTEWRPRMAFQAMLRLHERGEVIDLASVRSECDRLEERRGEVGTSGFMTEFLTMCMQKVANVEHAEKYARTVRSLTMRRETILAGTLITKAAQAGRDTDDALMGEITVQFDKLLSQQGSSGIQTAKELALRHADILYKREQKDPSVIGTPTGFKQLDEVAAYFPGELWYIAARPSVGKTAFMRSLWSSLGRRGIPSLFVSVEQPTVQIMDRTLSSMARVSGSRIAKGEATSAEWESIMKALSDFSEMPLSMIDDTNMTTAKLEVAVRLAKAKYGVQVVFIDYVQLIADEYGGNSNERISYISRRLLSVARATGTTIVSASQLSRLSGDSTEMPRLEHLRDSGALEQDAFVVLGLSRAINASATRLGLLKNRNGANGIVIDLEFDGERMTFWEPVKGFEKAQHSLVVEPAFPALSAG